VPNEVTGEAADAVSAVIYSRLMTTDTSSEMRTGRKIYRNRSDTKVGKSAIIYTVSHARGVRLVASAYK